MLMVVIVVASVNTRFLCEENYHCATGPNFTVLIRYTQFTSNNDSKVVNYDRRGRRLATGHTESDAPK